jgi:glucose 1-dehydrogenase
MGFEGKRAVVTGGGCGIGAGIAERLERLGAEVVTIDCNASTGASVVADLGVDGERVALKALDNHGLSDVIVNNIGVTPSSGFFGIDEEEWDRVFAVNLRGPWFFTKALVKALIAARRGGAILFVSSLHDTFICGWPHYSASKAGVSMLVKELAWELAPHSIRVNAVAPGGVYTGGNDLTPDGEYPRIPLGRIGLPDDIASIAAALLDDEVSGYSTGSRLPVDGGLTLYDWLHK